MTSVAAVSNLRWPYGCPSSGGRVGERRDHQSDHVVGAVHEAVVAVGDHRDAARKLAHHDLGPAHHQVQGQGDEQDPAHAGAGHVDAPGGGRASGHGYFILAPFSSVAKIQPTTLPGWIFSSAPQNWRSRRKREEVSRAEMPSISARIGGSAPASAPCWRARRSTQPARAHASMRSGVTSKASSSRVRGGILHSGPRSRRPSGSRMGMPMERMSRRRAASPRSRARRRAAISSGRACAHALHGAQVAAQEVPPRRAACAGAAGRGSRRRRCARRAAPRARAASRGPSGA